MCGIVGYCGHESKSLIRRLTDTLIHRGPDSYGIYDSDHNKVSLGHRRLSITDITFGHQPMHDSTQNFLIVFNGEIYNHVELRKDLQKDGLVFHSDHSDTEVILNGYKKWGYKVLEKLNGMFAFCIYDKLKKELFIAVDRFSKKPLYYANTDKKFIFSSELDAILKSSFLKNTLDILSLKKYFAYGFFPEPLTPYKDVYKLDAGTYLIFNIRTKSVIKKKYYEYDLQEDKSFLKRPLSDVVDEFIYLLEGSIKSRLVADKPLGIFLSGGVDSSLVLAIARKLKLNDEIKTFSIGFNEKSFDESRYASKASKIYQSKHYSNIVQYKDIGSLIDYLINNVDEPFNDSSIIPTYILSEFTSKNVNVALGGDGSDELFCGYSTFNAVYYSNFYKYLCGGKFVNVLNNIINKIPASEKYLSFDFKIKRFLKALQYPLPLWNNLWISPLNIKEIDELFGNKSDIDEIYSEVISLFDKHSDLSFMQQTNIFYVNFFLRHIILPKADRASMLNGLEVRSPFLDNSIVDFSSKIPMSLKFNNGESKYIVKKAAERFYDNDFVYRSKQGFAAPVTKWFKNLEPEDYSSISKFMNQDFIKRYISHHKQAKSDNRFFIWSYLMLGKHL